MKDLYKRTREAHINKNIIRLLKKFIGSYYVLLNGCITIVWGVLKTSENKNTSNITAINVDGVTVIDPLQVAEEFNFYFRNKPYSLKSDSTKVFEGCSTSSGSVFFLQATPLDILNVIKNLKNSNSTGYNELSNNIIKK